MENKLAMPEKFQVISSKLNTEVLQAIGEDGIILFEKAYVVANAITSIKTMLTDEYMKPIMELQNNKLGFKTDKQGGGYDLPTVKNCLIEAVLTGVQPTGNHFNIIAGNMYITKEGFGYLLKNIKGLKYDIVFDLPRIKDESAAVMATITWNVNGQSQEKKIDFPVKINKYMGADAVIGKATRKARAWLFYTVTGVEVSDGEVSETKDAEFTVQETISHDDLQFLFDAKRVALTPEEIKSAERIINNKEVASYKKLHTLLSGK